MAPDVSKDARPANMNSDGIVVSDMTYYELLGLRADADAAALKSAYKKAALKNHPDRNIGDVNAEQRFQQIGEAYQTLSDPNLRYVYDRKGIQTAETQAEQGFQDPGALFAMMFGGERFHSWIGDLAMGRDFTKAMDITMSEEEKAEMAKEEAEAIAKRKAGNNAALGVAAASPAPSANTPASSSGTSASSASAAGAKSSTSHLASSAATTSASTSPRPETPALDATKHNGSSTPTTAKGKATTKLSAEQRKQMDELSVERRKAEIERIQMLTNKLKDRVRPYVDAELATGRTPAEKQEEIQRWESRLREEVEDLKGQSFGIELCQLIGQIYVAKAASYLKTHRSSTSNLFGVSSWWGRMKDKKATIKEGWAFLSSTIKVQSAMVAIEKEQAKLGENPTEEDMSKFDEALMGKVMLVSWRGTRFEVGTVLRQVVDGTLAKEPGTPQTTMVVRAKAILVIGSLLSNVKADETDEERREMERLVAAAAQKKPRKDKAKHAA